MWSASGVSRSRLVDSDELLDLLRARQRAGHRDPGAVAEGAAHVTTFRNSSLTGSGDEPDVDAALLRQDRRVDVGHRVLDDVREQPLQRGELEHGDVVALRSPPAPRCPTAGYAGGDRRENRPRCSASGMPGRTSSPMTPPATLTASGTSSPASASRTLAATRRRPGPAPRRSTRRGGRDDDVVKLEQRTVGARLGGEDVQARAADVSTLDGIGKGRLVDQSAAGGVDDDHAGLGLASASLPIRPAVSLVLGRWTEMKSARPRSRRASETMPSCAARVPRHRGRTPRRTSRTRPAAERRGAIPRN